MTYAEALQAVLDEGPADRRKLMEHFMAQPEQTLGGATATTLMGYTHFVRVNQLLGRMGFSLYEKLGFHPEELEKGTFQGQTIISIRGTDTNGSYPWRLRPQVVAALLSLGFKTTTDTIDLPGDVALHDVPNYLEGRVRPIWVNAYERNPLARQKCLEIHGYTCSCCGLDMQAAYGLKAPFVHVHHLRQLSSIQGSYSVDPEHDLRPVCPNCHSVLHLTDPPMTVETLRTKLMK